jgi:hypothetical protein
LKIWNCWLNDWFCLETISEMTVRYVDRVTVDVNSVINQEDDLKTQRVESGKAECEELVTIFMRLCASDMNFGRGPDRNVGSSITWEICELLREKGKGRDCPCKTWGQLKSNLFRSALYASVCQSLKFEHRQMGQFHTNRSRTSLARLGLFFNSISCYKWFMKHKTKS